MIPTLTFLAGACLGWLFASLCAARKTPEPHSGTIGAMRPIYHSDDSTGECWESLCFVEGCCDDPRCWCNDPDWAEKNGS